MSTISAGTTTTTGYVVTSDTTGALVLKTGASGTTAVTIGSDQSVTFAGSQTFSGGTANGVLYLNGSKVATSGSALTFDGTNFATTGSGTLKNLLFSGGTLPAAGNPSIALRSSDNVIYHQSGSANSIVMLDSAQNTMQSIGATAQIWNISNSEQMRLTSTGLGIGTSSPAQKLDVRAAAGGIYLSSTTGTNQVALQTNNSGGDFYFGIDNSAGNNFNTGTAYAGVLWRSGANPICFVNNNTERMRLDSSGNLGLGVTPSAWASYKALQVLDSSFAVINNNQAVLTQNGAYTATEWRYINSNFASFYQQYQGQHRWHTAPSGTAGNAITFTQAMTLSVTGANSNNTTLNLKGGGGGGSDVAQIDFERDGTAVLGSIKLSRDGGNGAGAFQFFTNNGTSNTERARITAAGNFGIGLSTPQYRLSLGTTVGRKLAIYDDGTSGGVAAGFGTDLSGSSYELSSWAGSPGGGNGVFTWGQVNTTNGAFTEHMRIDTSGNVLVGMSSFSSGGIERTIAVSGNASAGFQLARVGAVAAYIYSYGSVGFRVETTSSYARVEFVSGGSGGVQLASAGATSWTSLSDERTKTDLVPITDAVQKVSSLRAVTGRFIKDGPETSRSFLIAQDFVDVFPQAVSTFKEKDDDTEYLGLAYTDTIPLLVAAIKEQQALIESLTQRIAALEGQ